MKEREEMLVWYLNDTLLNLIEKVQELAPIAKSELDKGIVLGEVFAIEHLLNQAMAFGIKEKLREEVRDFEGSQFTG